MPIINGLDTSTVAEDFLQAVYSYLSLEDREKIERTILSIPFIVDSNLIERAERIRDRLLGCLPAHHVYTAEASQRLTELAATGGPPENETPFQMSVYESSEYSARDFLSKAGVPVDDTANRRIQELELPVTLFASDYQNARPSLEVVRDILPSLRELRNALSDAEAVGLHPKQKDYAWGRLAEACAHAVKCADLTFDEEPGAFLLSVLREASQYPEPTSNPEYDAQFDETPSWGKPAARIDAAEGLAELSCSPSGATPDLLAILEGFIDDPVPSVRYQVAVRLLRLYETANAVMWRLIDRIVTEEQNRGVLYGIVKGVLAPLASKYPDKVTELARQIYYRATPGTPLRKACVEIFGGLFIWQAHAGAWGMIDSIITNSLIHSAECRHFVARLRDTLTSGLVEPTKPEHLSVRKRTWTVLLQVLHVVKEQWLLLDALAQEQGEWSEELKQKARGLVQIVDSACMQVYFSSGAFDNKRSSRNPDATSLGPDSLRLFFAEAGDVLDVLSDFSFAQVTHHLLKTLEYLVPVNPVEVFLRIGRTVFAGQEGGYQYESMAADLVVKLVERYLAEYRWIFRDNQACRHALLKLLDVFVQAGWPSTHRLIYRMDEIFR